MVSPSLLPASGWSTIPEVFHPSFRIDKDTLGVSTITELELERQRLCQSLPPATVSTLEVQNLRLTICLGEVDTCLPPKQNSLSSRLACLSRTTRARKGEQRCGKRSSSNDQVIGSEGWMYSSLLTNRDRRWIKGRIRGSLCPHSLGTMVLLQNSLLLSLDGRDGLEIYNYLLWALLTLREKLPQKDRVMRAICSPL